MSALKTFKIRKRVVFLEILCVFSQCKVVKLESDDKHIYCCCVYVYSAVYDIPISNLPLTYVIS